MGKDYLGTYNGSVFYPLNTDPNDVNIEAIAYALSNNSRFCGHTSKFWSVAQHSLLVAKFIRDELSEEISRAGLNPEKAEMLGLLHDASEAYLSDMCRPIKQFMQEYLKYEQMVQTKILGAFNLIDSEYEKYMEFVKIADDTILYAEAIVLMNPCEMWLDDYYDGFNKPKREEYQQYIKLENIQIVEAKFIDRCIELCNYLNLTDTPVDRLPKPEHTVYKPIYVLGKIPLYYMESMDGIHIRIAENAEDYLFKHRELDSVLDIVEYLKFKIGV